MIEPLNHISTTMGLEQVNEDNTPLETFLDDYSRGQGFLNGVSRPKALSTCTVTGPNKVACYVSSFYRERGYLPSIPSPSRFLEQERDIALYRYGLDNPNTWLSMQRCARLVSTLFGCPTIINLIFSDRVIVAAGSADMPCEPGYTLPLDMTTCSHTALLVDASLHEIPDTSNDWRFANMPSIPKAYFGQPVRLRSHDDGPQVPVAVICLMPNEAQTYKSKEEKMILSDLAEMLSQQMVGNWQTERRLKEEKMRAFVSSLMSAAVLKQSTLPTPSQSEANGDPSHTPHEPNPSAVIKQAAQQLRELLDCDFAAVLDLHAFHLTWESRENKKTSNFGWVRRGRRGTYSQGGEGPEQLPHECIKLLGYDMSERCRSQYSPMSAMNSIAAMDALSSYLQQYAGQEEPVFSQRSEGSPLQALLPKETQSHISIPLFNGGQPDLLVLVSTQTPYRKFETPDLTFASNVTLIIQSHITRLRLLQADAAKTAFLSVISHELRTPLHGLLCQLELIRESSTPEYLMEIQQHLDTAECCGFALRDVLNDVLEFGKMELTNKGQECPLDTSTRKRQTSPVDISSLATEVLSMSYGRKLQWDSVTGESGSPSSGVEVNLVYEDLPCGWEAEVDVAGLRRVLFNLASNALKYTTKGSITLEIREEPTPLTSATDNSLHSIQFSIKDTGMGMSEKFQQTLFTPFSQEDSFNPGSGLGLSICQGILKRMNGEIDIQSKLGYGTTVRVGLQVKFLRESPRFALGDPPRAVIRKKISNGHTIQCLSSGPLSPTPQPPAPTPTPITRQVPATRAIPLPKTIIPTMIRSNDKMDDVRVLVVDDNSIGRKVLTTLLQRRKINFAEASDGLQALGVFRSFRPDLVWTDVSMPVMNGVESAKRMREIERELKIPPARIVAITGLSTQREMKEGLLGEAAIDEWLIKGQADLKTLSSGLETFRKTRASVKSMTGA